MEKVAKKTSRGEYKGNDQKAKETKAHLREENLKALCQRKDPVQDIENLLTEHIADTIASFMDLS